MEQRKTRNRSKPQRKGGILKDEGVQEEKDDSTGWNWTGQ